jgi:hypothetical protein
MLSVSLASTNTLDWMAHPFAFFFAKGREPQGLKPKSISGAYGTAEAVPFHETPIASLPTAKTRTNTHT